jgi:hypothetical protein
MSNQDKDFDSKKAEQSELDLLLEKGMVFKVPKRSILRYFSKEKERLFTIKHLYAGTLDRLSNEAIKIDYNLESIKAQPILEGKRLAARHTRTVARIVAIAVLNGRWKIKLFTRPLLRYFCWRLTSKKLKELASIIVMMGNYEDFISSIILMSATRTTVPKVDVIEKKQAD